MHLLPAQRGDHIDWSLELNWHWGHWLREILFPKCKWNILRTKTNKSNSHAIVPSSYIAAVQPKKRVYSKVYVPTALQSQSVRRVGEPVRGGRWCRILIRAVRNLRR